MSENTSTTFGMHDIISMGVVSLGMKWKYADVKNTSKNSVIQMWPSSHLMPVMPLILTMMIPKGPKHS